MHPLEPDLAALVDDALGRGVGSAAAVSVGDGGVEIARVVRGYARTVPDRGPSIDEHAWFDVASLTKPIVTVASAMVLAGDGQLDLDAPIRRWLPDAASTGSVRQLLGHAAGCAAHVEFFRVLRHGADDPRGELVAMAAREPASAPGVAAVYSDLGYIMLGSILERVVGAPLEQVFAERVAAPLGLRARYPGTIPLAGAVATELDEPTTGTGRGLVCGVVHDENAYFGGGVCGHAGLFATIDDVARFGAAIVLTAAGTPRGRFRTDVVHAFATTAAAPGTTWRLGWDTPSATLGISHAGDRWPRTGSIGHLGFTGTSLWLDLPRQRWAALLTNRVHPSRHGGSADAIKALRRALHDRVVEVLGV